VLLVVTLVMTSVADAAGKKRDKPGSRGEARGWQIVFEDEFNEGALDERTWTTAFPWGRDRSSVGELQYYAPDAFRLKNGQLSIVAQPAHDGSHAYNSGLISSHDSFAPEYGRFEIRCKVPQGKGLWPAFWLLPLDTSWPPEIDVFEALGDDPETVHMTAHWSDGGAHRQKGSEFTGPDFSKDFHTFAVEWTPEKLTWFVDGVKRHEVSGRSPSGPMYLLANLAVGGDWPGAPDASTRFPASFDIDYIRAYAASPAPEASAKTRNDKKKTKANRKNRKQKRRAGLVRKVDGAR
jgi:beta-glucanase (GH16 family)